MFPDLKRDGERIAQMIHATKSEDRGRLLKIVADNLYDKSQGFTAGLIQEAAEKYGYPGQKR